MLEQALTLNLFAFFMVFARVGALIMVLPGFGDSYVSPRIRVMLALAIAFVLTPVVGGAFPAVPDSPLALLILIAFEIVIGVFLGAASRILISALQVAGTIIGYQISLANAFVFDPASAQQGALTGALLSVAAVTLIFVTNLHHLMLMGVANSYELFVPGALPAVADMADFVARAVSRSFVLAMQIAAPFIVAGLSLTVGVGLLNRLMPQVQMFFVAMPLQILLGIAVLMLTFSALMMWFLDVYRDGVVSVFAGG